MPGGGYLAERFALALSSILSLNEKRKINFEGALCQENDSLSVSYEGSSIAVGTSKVRIYVPDKEMGTSKIKSDHVLKQFRCGFLLGNFNNNSP